MGYLDQEPVPQRYTPPGTGHRKYRKTQPDENLEDLNNLGHEEIPEDFSDSPFADRV